MINEEPFKKTIKTLKDEGKYRVFNDIVRERGEFPQAIWYGPYNIKSPNAFQLLQQSFFAQFLRSL